MKENLMNPDYVIEHRLLPNLKHPINLINLKKEYSKISLNTKLDYVRSNLNEDEIQKKIVTYLENSGMDLSIQEICEEITNNEMFAAWFIKDSSKQNIYEKLQFQILLRFYKKKIKKDSKLYIFESKISTNKPDKCKSVDFIEEYITNNGKKLKILYFCKFTKDTYGGAQDNQAHDAITFLEEVNKYISTNDDDFRFVLLADGDYYQTIDFKNKTKKHINDKVKIHTINTINEQKWE